MILVDTNVLLDLVTDDPDWAEWSLARLEEAALAGPVLINDIVYAETSIRYHRIEDLDAMLAQASCDRDRSDAAFRAVSRRESFFSDTVWLAVRGLASGPIGEFAKGNGEQTAALDSAMKVVTLAKSIPAIFPPGSELTELPSKGGAAPTSWDDVDRFLDAQKRLVIETSKLLAAVNAAVGSDWSTAGDDAQAARLTPSNFATDCPCGGTLVFRPGQSTTCSEAHPHFTGWHTACCSLSQRALEAGMRRSRQSIHHF